jgi:hypothetical protein
VTELTLLELNAVLERAYPKGVFEEPDQTAFRTVEAWNRDVGVLRAAREEVCLHATVVWQLKETMEVAYTLQETMPFADWINWNDQGKLSWLAMNERLEQGFVVLWLRMSRIAPFYSLNFNLWQENGIEGRISCETVHPVLLDDRWRDAIAILKNNASRTGLTCWDKEWWGRSHPTITEIDWDNPIMETEDYIEEKDYPRRSAYLGHLIFGDR